MNIYASFRDWSKLPDDLLDLVAGRLELLAGHLRFSIVCKSWNRIIKGKKHKRDPPPMLLINPDGVEEWKVYNVNDDKLLNLELQVPNRRFCGSSKGWLIYVEENYTVTLVNPFYKVRGRQGRENSTIRLPQLPGTSNRQSRPDYYVHRAIISADPILNPQNCIVVIVTQLLSMLAYFRVGKDTTWTYVDGRKRSRGFVDVIFFEDKVYCVKSDCRLLCFGFNTRRNSSLQEVTDRIRNSSFPKNTYLYSNEKELWLIERSITVDCEYVKRTTTNFVIYKLDSDKRGWIKENSLGGVALFLGDNSLFTVSGSSFPGCLADCIYFTHDRHTIKPELGLLGPDDFGAYDVKDGCFLRVDDKHISTLVKMSRQPPIWVLPTFEL